MIGMQAVETSGAIIVGECEVQSEHCVAKTPAPITIVWTTPNRTQVNVCAACLDHMVRVGDWAIADSHIPARPDFGLFGDAGHLKLLVEVRRRPSSLNANVDEWARRIHRNLHAHGALRAGVPFLLAVVPGPFYFWSGGEFRDEPDYVLDVTDQLKADGNEELLLLSEVEIEGRVGEWLRGASCAAGNGDPLLTILHGTRVVPQPEMKLAG